MAHALIVDDDHATRSALSDVAETQGFSTATAGSLAEARDRMSDRRPDVVLIDLMLPDGLGLDLVENEAEDVPRPEVVLITGHATVESAIEALRRGAMDYLPKPVDLPRLRAVFEHVSRTLQLKQEVSQLRGELRKLGRFGRLIGASGTMQKVYDLIARVAPTDFTVLLTGESGTGKELVAQTLHELGPRRRSLFLPVNCAAIPQNLIESELFGHERGSFTGATQLHRGVFERAHGGTLFLDEVTEMSPELQARLLRVLETGTVVRVGGEDPIAVDVRVIAATNRPPEAAVREGKLREDLYYRLNVFPIPLPPLRDRPGDVALLAEFVLEQLNVEQGTQKRMTQGAVEALGRHDWPGNVRELRNALQRSFILAEDVIDVDCLPVASATPTMSTGGSPLEGIRVGASLDDVERTMILATLEHCRGDKKRTAQMLGISLKTLYNRLNVYAGRQDADARTM
jgi:DNA-binding NtrC family response regulator